MLQPGFRDAEEAERPLGQACAPAGRLHQGGQHQGVEQHPHLFGHPGQEKETGAPVLQGEAAGHAAGVQNLRPFGNEGQAGVALLPGNPALPQTPADALQQHLVAQEPQIQGLGRRGHGDVVFGGAEAPGNDDELRARQRLGQEVLKQRRVIP